MGKVDPYEVSGNIDYEKLVKQFGVSRITPSLLKRLGTDNLLVRRGGFYAHRDLGKITKGKFAIVSGRGPSANMHLGHLAVFKAIRDIQKKTGCFVFIPFSDDEKMLVRNLDYDEVRKMAIDNAKDVLALGFDPRRTKIMFDLSGMNQDVYNLAIRASSKITLSTIKAVMGFKDSKNIGSFFYPAIQAAHILYPTYKYKIPTLVMVGMDQDPFVRLTRDIAGKLGLRKPGDLINIYLPGLSGSGKMSASDPRSAIYTTDSKKDVERKIKRAFSGGRDTLEAHRKYGGNPDVDASYLYLKYFFEDDDKKLAQIYKDYKSGKMLTGDLKKYTIDKANKFLAKHQVARKKVKLERYLI
jgi:tryptophanyl-tRNA synthetase